MRVVVDVLGLSSMIPPCLNVFSQPTRIQVPRTHYMCYSCTLQCIAVTNVARLYTFTVLSGPLVTVKCPFPRLRVEQRRPSRGDRGANVLKKTADKGWSSRLSWERIAVSYRKI
jgi:hypothetical protein